MKNIRSFPFIWLMLSFLSTKSQDSSFNLVSTTNQAAKAKLADFPVITASPAAQNAFIEGLYWFEVGDYNKAKPLLQKAIDLDPNLAAAYTIQAMTWGNIEELANSLKLAKDHLTTASQWERLHYGIVETFLTDDMDKRLVLAEQMVTQFSNNARSYYELGNAFTIRGETDNARTNYQKAIVLAPDWTAAYDALSFSYLNESPQNALLAETYARKEVALLPTNAFPHILLGDTYRAQNKWKEANASYTTAIELDSTVASAYYKRGHVNNFAGKFAEARKDYQLAGKHDNVSPVLATQFVAYTHAYQDDHKKALQLLLEENNRLQESTTKNKSDFQYQLLEAAAYIAFHIKDAKTLSTVVDKWEPVYQVIAAAGGTDELQRIQKADLLYWRGLVHVLNGKYAEATVNAELMKQALSPINNPKKLESYHSLLGHFYYRQNDFNQAVIHFNQTSKTNIYAKYWLAKSYKKAAKKEQAQLLFNEISNYNFNDIGNALVRNEVQKK